MTHAELVERAVRWLRGHHGCGVVFAEMTTAVSETPDAIGWCRGWRNHGRSMVVECKTSRSDFHRDRSKHHHRIGRAMGSFRWYLAPAGLLRANDVAPGVGLAETRGRRVVVVREPELREQDRDVTSEVRLLVSAIQRTHLGVRFDRDRARWEPSLASDRRIAAEVETAELASLAAGRCAL